MPRIPLSASKTIRPKHVPQRTCIGCRVVLPKRSLIRLVRRPEGVQVDLTGKLAGRGAYLHNQRSCWERGLRGAINQALHVTLTAENRTQLAAFMAELPDADGPVPPGVEEGV